MIYALRAGERAEPYTLHDGKQYCGHLYLGGDGEQCGLDAWAEYSPSGWRIYWTGNGIPPMTRRYARGRWKNYASAFQAWDRATKSTLDQDKLEEES